MAWKHCALVGVALAVAIAAALGPNSHTLMICCVSPADSNMTESLNAVRYANRARNITNTPVVNYGDRSSAVIAELRQKVASLAQQLLDTRTGGGGGASADTLASTKPGRSGTYVSRAHAVRPHHASPAVGLVRLASSPCMGVATRWPCTRRRAPW